jgi:hypothetical protein
MSESDKPTGNSFLSRWSRRKVEANAQDGAVLPAEPLPELTPTRQAALPAAPGSCLADDPHTDRNPCTTSGTGAVAGAKMPETPHAEASLPAGAQAREALPSIDSLTHDADFSPFMARGVDPGLRNQAMKRLFTDPHYQFGQMDKLDIYIDDYSKSDPIPIEMLRQMNQAKSLFLFDDEETDSPSTPDAPLEDKTGAPPMEPAHLNNAATDAPGANASASRDTNATTTAEAAEDPKCIVGIAANSSAGKSG